MTRRNRWRGYPWRKPDVDKTPAEIILEGLWDIVRMVTMVIGVIGVIMVVLAIQVGRRNEALDSIDKDVRVLGQEVDVLQASTDEARIASNRAAVASDNAAEAATAARKTLEAAIEQSQGGGVDSGAVVDALEAIHRIEVQLCGGECPG